MVSLFAALILVSAGGHAAETTTKTVSIDGSKFQPAALTVKQGDTVVWNNSDPFPHTATAKGGEFDSKQIAPNGTWKFTAKKKGEFPYSCTIHPAMKGTLVVK